MLSSYRKRSTHEGWYALYAGLRAVVFDAIDLHVRLLSNNVSKVSGAYKVRSRASDEGVTSIIEFYSHYPSACLILYGKIALLG